jgi:hypothetical protein
MKRLGEPRPGHNGPIRAGRRGGRNCQLYLSGQLLSRIHRSRGEHTTGESLRMSVGLDSVSDMLTIFKIGCQVDSHGEIHTLRRAASVRRQTPPSWPVLSQFPAKRPEPVVHAVSQKWPA